MSADGIMDSNSDPSSDSKSDAKSLTTNCKNSNTGNNVINFSITRILNWKNSGKMTEMATTGECNSLLPIDMSMKSIHESDSIDCINKPSCREQNSLEGSSRVETSAERLLKHRLESCSQSKITENPDNCINMCLSNLSDSGCESNFSSRCISPTSSVSSRSSYSSENIANIMNEDSLHEDEQVLSPSKSSTPLGASSANVFRPIVHNANETSSGTFTKSLVSATSQDSTIAATNTNSVIADSSPISTIAASANYLGSSLAASQIIPKPEFPSVSQRLVSLPPKLPVQPPTQSLLYPRLHPGSPPTTEWPQLLHLQSLNHRLQQQGLEISGSPEACIKTEEYFRNLEYQLYMQYQGNGLYYELIIPLLYELL